MKNITYISASAGSGKTYELTERLKAAILEGKCKPEEVILTTFTKAAASEFKEKAKAKFYEAGKTKEANRLDQALIGTVDSVANVFVQRYWYLLGISPKLNVISEEDESVYVSESLSSLPTEEQNKFLHKFAEVFKIRESMSYSINYDFWKNDLKAIFNASRSYSIKDFSESLEASKKLIQSLSLSCSKLNFDREELLGKLEALDMISKADKPSGARDTRIDETERFRRIVQNPKTTQLEIGFGLAEMISKGKFTTRAYQASDDYLSLETESDKIWTCQEVRDLQITYVEALFEIAGRWQEKYVEYKKEQHILDYTDMEEYLLELITNEEYKSVQEDVKASYKYLFVDEFQDCSPTQIKIFDKLSDLVEQTIWVGDYKQAIYGFRGSDTALVKAVTDRIEKINGHSNETLGTSHRSWPPIVDVTNAVFVPAFSDILREDEVRLATWDKLEKEYNESKRTDLLKCWVLTEKVKAKKAAQIAGNIAKMIQDGEKPKDIAVLARTNSELTAVASALKDFNIPALVGDSDFQSSREITLLNALLSLVVNSYDTMARATIAYITEDRYTAAEILDKRFEDKSNKLSDGEYLAEVSLIKKLMAKRDAYKSMSVCALVESLIIEMDLYNVVKSWPDSDNSVNTFHTAISIAQAYEDHCIQMSLPCTIYGFIDYITTIKAKAAGMSDGVQLFTYHGSKGLQWKTVILMSLEDDILDENNLVGRGIYGVHTFHEDAPNAENPYPPMTVTVLPWIFGSAKGVPQSIKDIILKSKRFTQTRNEVIQEEKRLMYVAMTRPEQSLILVSLQDNGLLRLKEMGVNTVDSIPALEKSDILGTGQSFVIENPNDMEGWKFKTPENKVLKLYSPKEELRKRDQQPSSCKSTMSVKAETLFDSGKRITLRASNEEMNKVGTCIHNIFCVLEQNPTVEQAESIIRNHQMEKKIPNVTEIVDAWEFFEEFLTEKYGEKTATYHELPFKQFYNGQFFTGSIDFIWETKDGVILVDFKSYPGSKADVINPEHEHFACIYAGQFECYERALKEAGKKILAKIVYYHVLGVGVELK